MLIHVLLGRNANTAVPQHLVNDLLRIQQVVQKLNSRLELDPVSRRITLKLSGWSLLDHEAQHSLGQTLSNLLKRIQMIPVHASDQDRRTPDVEHGLHSEQPPTREDPAFVGLDG